MGGAYQSANNFFSSVAHRNPWVDLAKSPILGRASLFCLIVSAWTVFGVSVDSDFGEKISLKSRRAEACARLVQSSRDPLLR